MKTLILMRHAKSDWTGALPDHDRPLNPRGIRSARALGDWLRAEALSPDEALVSTARRTRETYGLLALDGPVRFDSELYEAPAAQILRRLGTARGDTVLMVGHNPGIGLLMHQLARQTPDHPRWDDIPTGATCMARIDAPWADVTSGKVAAFLTPHDLMDA